jgi:hypothetical protein
LKQEQSAWENYCEAAALVPLYERRSGFILYGNLQKGQKAYGPFKWSDAVRISERVNNRGYNITKDGLKHRVTFATVFEMCNYEP